MSKVLDRAGAQDCGQFISILINSRLSKRFSWFIMIFQREASATVEIRDGAIFHETRP